MNSEDLKKMMGESWDRAFMDACYGPAQTARITGACTNTDPPQPAQIKAAPNIVCEPKTATAIRAQMESVQERMLRYQAEDMRRASMFEAVQWSQEVLDKITICPPLRFNTIRPKADPAPLTFTALQETVLPDLYGKKQHAQLLAAAKQRKVDAAARLREETNNKIGGLLRGFLGARREEEV